MYISLTLVAKSDKNFVKMKWNQSNWDLDYQTSIAGTRPKNVSSLDQQLFNCLNMVSKDLTYPILLKCFQIISKNVKWHLIV